jgi:hypothetical protein
MNHVSYTYTGKESTPQGLGYCAEAEEIGKVMTGRDKHMWTVGIKNAMKVWVRIPDQMVAKKEVAPMLKPQAEPEAPPALVLDDAPAAEETEEDLPELEDTAVVEDEPAPVVEKKPVAKKKPAAKKAVEPEQEPEAPAPVAKKAAAKKKPAAKKAGEREDWEGEAPAAAKKKPAPVAAADDTASETSSTIEKKKRAPTAFNLFVKEKIAELRAAEPGLAQKEYMSKAAAAWNDFKAENGMPATKPTKPKAPKEPKAEKEAKAPKKTKKAAAVADDASSTTSEKKKRAPTAYNIFIKEKMAELRAAEPGLPAKEYMSKAAAMYRDSKAV